MLTEFKRKNLDGQVVSISVFTGTAGRGVIKITNTSSGASSSFECEFNDAVAIGETLLLMNRLFWGGSDANA